MDSRLKKHYKETVVPKLMKEMGYKNPHQVPRLVKIVLNSGIGKDNKDAKILGNPAG
jgi:large subunit ribosomal protein L5